MKQSTRIWLLAGVMVLASFFRLYHITTTPPGLYPDQAMDGNNALEVLQTGHFQTFYVEDNGREGLYVNILVFFIKAFGNKPWVVRLPAAIAGILTVFGMYFLVQELFERDEGSSFAEFPEGKKRIRDNAKESSLSRATGHVSQYLPLLSAFLLATSFWHINFSRIGFRAILAPLCLIWALYFFLKAIQYDKGQGTRLKKNPLTRATGHVSLLYALLAGAIFGLGFYTYIAYRVMPLLFLLFIPFFKKYPGFWKKFCLFVIVTFLVALPIGIYFLHHPSDFFGRTSEIAVTNSTSPLGAFAINVAKTALMFNFRGDGNWRHNVSGMPELWWPVGILFAIGILVGIWSLWRKSDKGHVTSDKAGKNSLSRVTGHLSRFPILLILAWLLLAGLPAAASNDGIPHALRSILMLPPAIILAAIGGVWLYEMARRRKREEGGKRLIDAIAIIFLASAVIFAYMEYFVAWGQNPNVAGSFNANYVAIGEQINALPSSIQKYVVVNAGGVLARGVPVPAETVMFITNSFTTSTQLTNHITYLLPNQTHQIPRNTPGSSIFYIN